MADTIQVREVLDLLAWARKKKPMGFTHLYTDWLEAQIKEMQNAQA